jgi:DNA-binding CsgD family transcriptional regulator
MPVGNPNVDDLILTIHSAALAADGWTRIVNDLSQALSAEAASLIRPTHAATIKPFCHLLEREASYVRDYMDQWAQHDIWYQGAVRNRRIGVGMVNVDSQLVDRHEFERSPFFNEYLRQFDIDKMMNVCLAAPDPDGSYGPVAMSFYRGLGKESFSTQEVQLLSHLAPHLTVAAKNYWMAQSLRSMTSARANALNAVTSAVFAVNRAGRLMFTNRLGEEMIRGATWVRVLRGLLAPVIEIHAADRFAAGLSRLSSGIGSEFLVTDSVAGAEAQVSMMPIPADVDFGWVMANPSSLIWITPIAPRTDVGQNMARLFDLTPAERRILDKLMAGEDLRDAAASLRISIHTARTQLKSMFRKTGRRSQGQLLMLATRIATLSSNLS